VRNHPGRILFGFAMAAAASSSMGGAVEYRDPLDIAVAAPDDTSVVQRTDQLILYAADSFTYDNNIYRLPSSVTDLTTLPGIGHNPTRQDYIDTATGGLTSEWLTGARQSVDVDLRADYNRYFKNSDLSNVSSSDRVAWNWGLTDALSGKVGADYTRLIGGFVNTQVYSRDIVSRYDYFASMRYQVGPRWGVFGGLLGSNYSVSASQAFNNSKSKGVDVGADFTTELNRIGFDYRYNDSRAPNSTILNGVLFDPDYREERARLLFRYALSEKTLVDASAGYLKRDYPSTAIGSFSGEIWRAAVQWQPTPKTQLLFGAWQQLDADLTSQTDYFVDKGVSLTPEWVASAKVTVSLTVAHDTENYVGSNPLGPIPVDFAAQARHDTVTSETGSLVYTPIRSITLTFSAAHVTRNSNVPQFQFNDFQTTANITYRFFRYGETQ
jgi:hypothetical protein